MQKQRGGDCWRMEFLLISLGVLLTTTSSLAGVVCPGLIIPNASLNTSDANYSTTVLVTCNSGYAIDAYNTTQSAVTVCTSSGNWNSSIVCLACQTTNTFTLMNNYSVAATFAQMFANNFNSISQYNLTACKQWCIDSPTCISIDFVNATQKCALYNVSGSFLFASSSTLLYIHYDLYRVTCTAVNTNYSSAIPTTTVVTTINSAVSTTQMFTATTSAVLNTTVATATFSAAQTTKGAATTASAAPITTAITRKVFQVQTFKSTIKQNVPFETDYANPNSAKYATLVNSMTSLVNQAMQSFYGTKGVDVTCKDFSFSSGSLISTFTIVISSDPSLPFSSSMVTDLLTAALPNVVPGSVRVEQVFTSSELNFVQTFVLIFVPTMTTVILFGITLACV